MKRNHIYSVDELLSVSLERDVYIYGAGNFAHEIGDCLNSNGVRINGFLVSSNAGNPDEIDKIKVTEYSAFLKQDNSDLSNAVLVIGINQGEKVFGDSFDKDGWGKIEFSTPELITDILVNKLKKLKGENETKRVIKTGYPELETGFAMICDMNEVPMARLLMMDVNAELVDKISNCNREGFAELYGEASYVGSCGKTGFENENAVIYIVTSLNNKTAVSLNVRPGYELIQGGAALATEKMSCLHDDDGLNISDKNGIYSECTVHYWVWKNIQDKDYVGISHYRRQQQLGDSDVRWMKEKGVDFITAMPQFVLQKLVDFYSKYIDIKYWDFMQEAFSQINDDYAEIFVQVRDGHFYFPCNIFFAKKDAFDHYCSFMFDVTARIEKIIEKSGFLVDKRYMGYLTEIIESVYFAINKDKIKIAYTDVKYIKN